MVLKRLQNCGPLLAWQPLSSATVFQFRLDSIGIGSYRNSKGWNAVSDTANAFIGAPVSITDNIANVVGAEYDYNYGLYFIDCKASPPPINIFIGGKSYSINSQELIIDGGFDNGCYFLIEPIDAGGFGSAFVLGDPFIRQYCNTYDYGGKRIGFSAANV